MNCIRYGILLGGVYLGLVAIAVAAQNAAPDSVRESRRVYKTIGARELALHVFAREGTPPPAGRSAIVFIHGGGWASGEPSVFFAACRRYAALGLVAFSVEYRLSDNRKGDLASPVNTPIECVLDVRSALRWVRGHAREFGINPQKIAVGGHSVGGQLTLATAMIDSFNEATDDLSVSPVPNAMLLYSGTPDTIEAWCDYLLADRRRHLWALSPAHNVKPGLPPAIAFHGKDDTVVPFWKVGRLKQFMEKAGNTFELHAYAGRKHYLAEGNPTYARILDDEILAKTDDFLRRHGFL